MNGSRITLAVTGAIAAYKAVYLLRLLRNAGADVQVIGTEHSLQFIGAETWRGLSGRPPLFGLWEQTEKGKINHIMLGQEVDLVIVAPASANIIAKAAHGIADDLVSSVLLAATVPILFAPGMNTAMYEHPATRQNLATLASRPGVTVMSCGEGALACGTQGAGRMAEPYAIFETARFLLTPKKQERLSWLIAAGATREHLDPIRFITNGSTGATGRAIADAAWRQGDAVTLVAGNMAPLPAHYPIYPVVSAADMYERVISMAPQCDVLCMSAAVADYAPERAEHKIKKGTPQKTITLRSTPDILAETATLTPSRCFRVGFAAETEDLIENARAKLKKKHLDLVVANLVDAHHNPFGGTVNRVTLVTPSGEEPLPEMNKEALGELLATRIHDAAVLKRRG